MTHCHRRDAAARHAAWAARRRAVLGVSLIEALVALAVMAFGMLGVVGMQTSLRANSDLSRQRGEAVRLAQEEVERWRNYSVLRASDAASGQLAFEEIVDTGPEVLTVPEVNTEFTRRTEVESEVAGGPLVRQLAVTVGWTDRRGEAQTVRLMTQVGFVPPELGALPGLRGDRGPLGAPGGRNPQIPRGAVPFDASRSRFDPPGGGGVGWLFNNNSGLIVGFCPPPPAPASACTDTNRQLVAGSIAFSLSTSPTRAAPSASDAELPLSAMPTDMVVGIRVRRAFPTPVEFESCIASASADRTRVSYYCAVLADSVSKEWRGAIDPIIRIGGSVVDGVVTGGVDVRASDTYPGATPATTPPVWTADPTDADPAKYRVCRYTPSAENRWTPSDITPAGLLAHNTVHPYRYFNARQPYSNRNFLVIQAGFDGAVFRCPTENPATPIQSNTFHHPRLPP